MRHLYKPLRHRRGRLLLYRRTDYARHSRPRLAVHLHRPGHLGYRIHLARRANIFMKHVVLTAWYRYRAWRQQRKERKATRKAERKATAANQR